MSGYTKNIAVIRGLKSGFSVDGGELSGLIKAEKYGNNLKIEVSLINFAPLTQGKYVCAVSDGNEVCVMDGLAFDGISRVDTGDGFAALICYVGDEVSPIASAVCGAFHSAVLTLRDEIERQEISRGAVPIKYEDEALAQENYYEFGQTYKDSGAVCESKEEKENGDSVHENEKAHGAEKEYSGGLSSGGSFYSRMREEIENVLSSYPKEEALENMVENSRWVKINYGENKFYVFGVIYGNGEAQYICYGVPSDNPDNPPPSLENCSFIPAYPTGNAGYWIMYQDAKTGASIKISAS